MSENNIITETFQNESTFRNTNANKVHGLTYEQGLVGEVDFLNAFAGKRHRRIQDKDDKKNDKDNKQKEKDKEEQINEPIEYPDTVTPTSHPSFVPTSKKSGIPSVETTHHPSLMRTESPTQRLTPFPTFVISTMTRATSIPTQVSTPIPTIIVPAGKDVIIEKSPAGLFYGSEVDKSSNPTYEKDANMFEDRPQVLVDFSVLMKEEYQNVNSEKVLARQDRGLVLNILQTMTRILCNNTDFQIFATNNPGKDVCEQFRIRRRQLRTSSKLSSRIRQREGQASSAVTILSVDPFDSVNSINDGYLPRNQTFMELTLHYNIEKIGDWYFKLSDMTMGSSSPELIIQTTVQEIVMEHVEDGRFGDTLQEQDQRVQKVAPIGKELEVFGPVVIDDDVFKNNAVIVEPSREILYPLRLSGIVMALSLVTLSFLFYKTGKSRLLKILETEDKLSKNNDTLGLANEDAVMEMLDAGRNKTVMHDVMEENGSSQLGEGANKLKKPDWEVAVGYGNPLIIS